MKPPPFGYSRPETLDEALAELGRLGPDGKVLAGGQSLIPLLSMRLAAPRHLVDVNRIAALDYIDVAADGVRVGALARHAAVERSEDARAVQPLLGQAERLVAHPTIRNRGTAVGSLAHADPSGEMPVVLALLGGSVRVARTGGVRVVPAERFFLGPLEADLAPGELVIEAFFPALAPQSGTAFVELARRHGDYAMCGVAALVELDDDLHIASARIGLLSVAPTPLVIDASGALRGRAFDADLSRAADEVRNLVDPEPDIHATAEYRRHLAGVLSTRALTAAARAGVPA